MALSEASMALADAVAVGDSLKSIQHEAIRGLLQLMAKGQCEPFGKQPNGMGARPLQIVFNPVSHTKELLCEVRRSSDTKDTFSKHARAWAKMSESALDAAKEKVLQTRCYQVYAYQADADVPNLKAYREQHLRRLRSQRRASINLWLSLGHNVSELQSNLMRKGSESGQDIPRDLMNSLSSIIAEGALSTEAKRLV